MRTPWIRLAAGFILGLALLGVIALHYCPALATWLHHWTGWY